MVDLTVHVVEVGMAAPDIVCMVIRDQDPEFKGLLQLSVPDAGTYFSLVQRDPVTGGAGSDYAHVVGQLNGVQKMFLQFRDKQPTVFLDRAAVDDPSKWSTIGGRTVTAVYRKSKPFGQTTSYAPLQYDGSTMEHHIFLKLNGNLAQGGPYTISITGNTFPAYAFTFNDRTTRSISLRAAQTGYRARENTKFANLQLWIPGYGTEGRIDFANDYSLTTAELIDDQGVTVYTGNLVLLTNATDVESGYVNYDYASTTTPPKVATSVALGSPNTITIVGHGYSSGQKKYFQGFGHSSDGTENGMDGLHTITVTGADTFTITGSYTSWLQGTYRSGYDSLVFDTWNGNRWATNVYQFDFSGFNATAYQGTYRVRVPGLGVSDSFTLMEHTRHNEANVYMKGYYNQLTGMALDTAVGGFDRPIAAFKDGANGVEIYESVVPGCISNEGITIANGIWASAGAASCISFSANLITGNSLSGKINGVSFGPVVFSSSHDTTMGNICTAIMAALPGVTATTRDKIIFVYNKIGSGIALGTLFTFTNMSLTGGASQATIKLSPFVTNTRVTNWGPTVRDAGDWDYYGNTLNEGGIAYWLLEYGYRHLPAIKRDVSFGFPKASTLDPVLYAGTDGLGDQFHMAIYQIDSFRKTQKVDGRVYGGMGYANGSSGGGGYSILEPSWISTTLPVLMAADPASNVTYAACAAKVAQVLSEAGFTSAATTWQTSAELAWDWSEAIYQDWAANGYTGSVVNGYFEGTLGLRTIGVGIDGSFYSDNTVWSGILTSILGGSVFAGQRYMAAGALYNLTDNNTKYGSIIATQYNQGNSGDIAHGIWEFCQSTDAQTRYPTEVAYASGRWNVGVASYSRFDILARYAFSLPQNQNNQAVQWMQQQLNYRHGINQENMTAVVGLGHRWPNNMSVRDAEAINAERPGGVPLFHFPGQPAYAGFFNYSSDSSVNYTVCNPRASGGDPAWEGKTMTPYPVCRPFEESFNDNTNSIYLTEFQAINCVSWFSMAVVCHCFDGNDVTEEVVGRYKRRLNCAA